MKFVVFNTYKLNGHLFFSHKQGRDAYAAQGWEYLHQYFFGEADNKTASLLYVIIQKNVEDFWQKKWTQDLGPSGVVLKKQFG